MRHDGRNLFRLKGMAAEVLVYRMMLNEISSGRRVNTEWKMGNKEAVWIRLRGGHIT